MQSDSPSVVRAAKLSTDSEDTSEDLDALDGVTVERRRLRRKRHHSRPRIKRAKSATSTAGKNADVSAIQLTAQHVAKRIGAADEDANLDLKCSVAGVTHRGGFKLRVMGVEQLTSSMLDRWRAICASQGYTSSVSFDVTASEANIIATPLFVTAKSSWFRCVPNVDPLNALFLGALALNALRHALDAAL